MYLSINPYTFIYCAMYIVHTIKTTGSLFHTLMFLAVAILIFTRTIN